MTVIDDSTLWPVLRLRPAAQSDAEAVARLWFAGWPDGHAGHVPRALVRHRRLENFRDLVSTRLGNTTVAEDESQVVGFVTVIDDQIEQIYVAKEARGGGPATALLAYAESVIAEEFERGWLAVVSGNARARRFYERNGWHDAGPLNYMAETEIGRLVVPTRRYTKRLHREPNQPTTEFIESSSMSATAGRPPIAVEELQATIDRLLPLSASQLRLS
jgi:GNAT superfamily N-acetyltransferase